MAVTIKLPQEVALSLDQQLTRQHKVKIQNINDNVRLSFVKCRLHIRICTYNYSNVLIEPLILIFYFVTLYRNKTRWLVQKV